MAGGPAATDCGHRQVHRRRARRGRVRQPRADRRGGDRGAPVVRAARARSAGALHLAAEDRRAGRARSRRSRGANHRRGRPADPRRRGGTRLPTTDAVAEVGRAIQTLIVSAEEAKRLVGEMVPIDAAPGQSNRMAFTIRVPRGVVCGITAFNSPFNMVCHKVAPALASGNTVVIKPSEVAPLSATRLFELLLEAGFPPGHVNLVHGLGADVGPWLIENRGVDFYTFTGSSTVGHWLRERAGLRPIVLELGSISPPIVCEDADLDGAAARCAASAFRRAGQVCTSTQRLFVHRDVEPAFTAKLIAATSALHVGDPRDPSTDVEPMISERE